MSTNMTQPDYGYNNQTATGVKESQVNKSCAALEFALQELHKSCAETEQRLRPLLRNEPEATTASDKQSQPTMVPLATQIEGYVREVRVAIATQQSILRRLEL